MERFALICDEFCFKFGRIIFVLKVEGAGVCEVGGGG
jgi:hypothetical protein